MSTPCDSGTTLPLDTTRTVPEAAAGYTEVVPLSAGGFWRSHGLALDAQGYELVPIIPGTKRPAGLNWVRTDYNTDKALRRGFRGFGVGVKTGDVVAVDIDCTDPEVVQQVVAWFREHVGPAIIRIGRAPRSMLLYRTSVPRRKVQSLAWTAPDGEVQRVEILGERQQFVAYAIHPGTGQPYSWPDGNLTDMPFDELTEISERQGYAGIHYFVSLARAAGWQQVKPSAIRDRGGEHKSGRHQQAPLWLLKAALEVLPRRIADDYDSWIRIGAALHCATNGSPDGLRLFDEWSRQSDKYNGDTDEKWKTFGDKRPDRAGAGTIFHMANTTAPGWRQRAVEAHAAALAASRPRALYRVGEDTFDMTEVAERLRRAKGASL